MDVFENVIYIQCYLLILINISNASHFDSGTITCDNTVGTTVLCKWKTGWVLNRGNSPCCGSCTAASVGSLSPCNATDWQCASGCSGTVASSAPYTLTGWNTQENWEEGENTFTYTFAGNGPYTIEYTNCCWRSLALGGSSARWSVRTTFSLGARSDTGSGNKAPQSVGLPVYRQQFGCGIVTMVLPMSDSDGDNVQCRGATGAECSGVCNSFPHSAINSTYPNCILTFDTSGSSVSSGDWFAVALMIEDFPTTPITMGSATFTPTTAISSVPLQFLVYVPTITGVSCTAVPVFVSPTPAANAAFSVNVGGSISITIQAQDTSGLPVQTITVSGPAGGTVTPTSGVSSGTGTNRFVVWSWTPIASQSGAFQVCFQAADGYAKTTEFRCVIVVSAITCPDPGFGTNSNRNPSTSQTFNYGDTVTYSCQLGFPTSSGSTNRICQLSGTFDGTAFACIPVSCPDPGYGVNSNRSVGNQNFVYQDQVEYFCDVGYYHVAGDGNRTCQANGTFSGSTFTCDPVPCLDPGYGVNANRSHVNQSFVYQDTVSYSCDLGYMPSTGNPIRTCEATGVFNGSAYTCAPVPCPDPGYGVNANRSVGNQSFVYQDQVEYACNLGYYHEAGDGNRTCQANGTFSGSNFTCDPVPCPDPGYGVNANRSHFNQSFVYQDSVTYECLPGFVFVEGDEWRNCTYNGTFDGLNMTCAPVESTTTSDPWWPWLLVGLACLLLLIIAAVLIYLLCRRRKRKRQEDERKRLTTPAVYVAPMPPKSTRSRTSLSFTNKVMQRVIPAAPSVLPVVEKTGEHPAPKPLQKKPPAKPLEKKPPPKKETAKDTPPHPPPAPLIKSRDTDKPPMLGGISRAPNVSNLPTLPAAVPAVNILYNSTANLTPASPDRPREASPQDTDLPRESKSVTYESTDIPQLIPPVIRPQTVGDVPKETDAPRRRRSRPQNLIPDATPRYLLPRAKSVPAKKLTEPERKPKKKVKAPPRYLQPRTKFIPDGVTPDKIYVNSQPRKYTVGNWVETKPDWDN